MRVGIVGYALDRYESSVNLSIEEMGFNVCKLAQQAAGIKREEIESVHNSTMDMFDGITISHGLLIPAAGGYDRDATRIQNGGVFAILSACAKILSGSVDVAMVASADAVTYDLTRVSNMSTDPFFQQGLGFNHLTSFALFSCQYMKERNLREEDFAFVAAKNYRAGANNPHALVKEAHSLEAVMTSPMLAWPLRSLEVVESRAFGGAALILASEERAKALSDSPIWITGFGMGTNSVNVGDAVRMSALQKAAKAAYKMAGIQDPAHEVHVVELNDPFSPWELAACEALGLCGTRGTVELAREGITSLDGKMPINPSGGTLCTNAPNSGGIFRTIQAAMYLRNDPHGGARKALVHDSDMSIGLIGDSHALMVIERVE